MARTAYDFLPDSFLFNSDLISDGFASVPPQRLEAELQRYREHILKFAAELEAEIAPPDSGLSIYFDTASRAHPTVDLLKQCVLYYDQAIVDDPLFALTAPHHPLGDASGQALGYAARSINPKRIASAAMLMKTLTPMVAGGFLKFVPISHHYEPPPEIPMRYSESLFADGIPRTAGELLRGAAAVHAMRRGEQGWFYRLGDPLAPSRGICIEFNGYGSADAALSFVYHLFATRVTAVDEDAGLLQVVMEVPDAPPTPEEFAIWIAQSINQASHRILRDLALDCATALRYRSMLCTNSPLIARLLALEADGAHHLESELAQTALQVEVPVLTNASVRTLMDVRENNGQPFENFRTALAREMRNLRSVSDPAERSRRIQELSHEFAKCQVQDVDAAAKRVLGSLALEGVVGVASLAAVMPASAGSAGFFGLLASAFTGALTIKEYLSDIKGHPGYFLWQLKRATKSEGRSGA